MNWKELLKTTPKRLAIAASAGVTLGFAVVGVHDTYAAWSHPKLPEPQHSQEIAACMELFGSYGECRCLEMVYVKDPERIKADVLGVVKECEAYREPK